jgi:EAL domain-containing protein (putative c-di-GMP-specific phosphodiesterase class I)
MENRASSRVLLVDEDPPRSERYACALADGGYDVTRTTAADAALEASSGEFDVLINLVALPRPDRRSVLENIREIDPDLPLIVVASERALDGAMFALEQRVLRLLIDPVDPSALADALSEAVEIGASARARRAALGRSQLDAAALVSLRTQLGRAIDHLWIAYHPIVSSSTNQIMAFEALVRSDEKSLPDPKAVLGAAARLHELPRLGRAIRGAVAHALDESPFDAFVNLHPCDLADDELFAASAPLTRHAHRVVLEITERASLEMVFEPGKRLAALRELGYRFAIDDLGAGYAGLASVVALEPEVVKIDLSLVRGIETSSTRRALVRLLVDMARSIHADVIAEGIETAAERAVLADLGCDLMQGYLFGRPTRGRPVR